VSRARIFCVDDDLITLGFLADVLGEQHEVSVCSKPQRAVEQALALKPDLILLDIYMPTLGGEGLLASFKSNDELAQLPVLIFTANADTTDLIALLQHGIRGLIEKPVDPQVLLQKVAYVLKHPDYV